MDVWHRHRHRELARYAGGQRDIVLIGEYGPGTPVGQFDRYDLLDAVTGRSVVPTIRLYEPPAEEDVRRWLATAEMAG